MRHTRKIGVSENKNIKLLGSLVNAAIAQSGCFLNAFSHVLLYDQDKLEYNNYTDKFCTTDKCTPETSTAEKWEILKTIPAEEIWASLNEAFIFPGPIPFDGVFYKEDAFEKFKRGDLDTSTTYVMGINSFEGSLLRGQLGYFGYNEENPFPSIEALVDWINTSILKPYSEFQSMENSEIAKEYIEEFNGYLSDPVTEFSFEQQVTIGGQIQGDSHFILPAIEEALKYAKAGTNIFYSIPKSKKIKK